MHRRTALLMLSATFAGLSGHAPAWAQTDLSFEVGASQVGPPAGLEGESTRFGIGGMRFSHFGSSGSGLTASLMFGTSFGDSATDDFVSGVLTGALRGRWTSSWTGGMDFQVIGFQVRDPFPYSTFALEGGPRVTVQSGALSVTVAGVAGVGRSQLELWRVPTGIHRTFQDDLWRVGGTTEMLLGTGTLRFGVAGSVHQAAGGGYQSGGGRLVLGGGWGAAEVRADVWQTPLGREVTGGVAFAIPLSGWSLRGFLGKSDPDPLTLAEPGSGSAGVLVGRSLYSSDNSRADADGLPYEVLSLQDGRARVRITLEVPRTAGSVSVLGDFTLWDPIPMRGGSGRWVAEVDVPAGTHHYGFLVDDEWYLPDDTRDVVPDEWGRLSAILVIEGAS